MLVNGVRHEIEPLRWMTDPDALPSEQQEEDICPTDRFSRVALDSLRTMEGPRHDQEGRNGIRIKPREGMERRSRHGRIQVRYR